MKETHFLNAVGEKLRFTQRIVPAVIVGALVTQVVLRMNNGKRTPQMYGGWRELDLSEFSDPAKTIETFAEVIPLHSPNGQTSPESSGEIKVIGVEDTPKGTHPPADLHVVPRLIDVEDIPG